MRRTDLYERFLEAHAKEVLIVAMNMSGRKGFTTLGFVGRILIECESNEWYDNGMIEESKEWNRKLNNVLDEHLRSSKTTLMSDVMRYVFEYSISQDKDFFITRIEHRVSVEIKMFGLSEVLKDFIMNDVVGAAIMVYEWR